MPSTFTHKLPGKVFRPESKRLGKRWTRLRAKWIRFNPTCVKCGKPGEEVHHIIPRTAAPERRFDLNNLETLCHDCHQQAHRAE